MHENVLLLAPSRGLGGGIERYVSTIEAVFTRHKVEYRRLDLLNVERSNGIVTKARFVQEVLQAVRRSPGPTRLVLAHCNLLPVVQFAARSSNFTGATVILHGLEIWSSQRIRGHRTMRRADVRVVTASNFSAGALARTSPANVLHPGVSSAWYQTLVDAAEQARPAPSELNLVTAFRLDDWRDKGLGALLDAVRLLGDDRVRLTVCGSGPVTPALRKAVAPYPWCRLRPGLTDQMLAQQLASADLFVLATRTRSGANACGEGFGLVLLEAQLAGTAVVVPAYGGSGEAFQPGITGLAPLDETPEALAAVLASLLADDQRRAEMGRAAVAWARTRFEPIAYGENLLRTLLRHPAPKLDRSPVQPTLLEAP
ncbi:MAG TPA: glycosyltransferase family 4 protein [Planosporangium sp.]|jgi:glycosyltransferase involved in cell wall biosynthesis|nr:glycosyltransferase family 4 protein [Planosporangium sp.]